MNSKQRRTLRRKLERMDDTEQFVAWVNGADGGPLVYSISDEKESGNRMYWATRAGTTPGKFTKEHAFKIMGCAKITTPSAKGGTT